MSTTNSREVPLKYQILSIQLTASWLKRARTMSACRAGDRICVIAASLDFLTEVRSNKYERIFVVNLWLNTPCALNILDTSSTLLLLSAESFVNDVKTPIRNTDTNRAHALPQTRVKIAARSRSILVTGPMSPIEIPVWIVVAQYMAVIHFTPTEASLTPAMSSQFPSSFSSARAVAPSPQASQCVVIKSRPPKFMIPTRAYEKVMLARSFCNTLDMRMNRNNLTKRNIRASFMILNWRGAVPSGTTKTIRSTGTTETASGRNQVSRYRFAMDLFSETSRPLVSLYMTKNCNIMSNMKTRSTNRPTTKAKLTPRSSKPICTGVTQHVHNRANDVTTSQRRITLLSSGLIKNLDGVSTTVSSGSVASRNCS
mmetsp:Transcript_21617/g.52721  ORF Transcript_21617/g.52721 Transcript_21617/m.52721 type:complete len:370 (-) Transcript_21617:185-1294(-)